MIDLSFPVFGEYLPSDHNYGLYSALVHHCQQLKEIDWQLGTITGIPDGKGLINLGSKSRLKIRCAIEHAHLFQPTNLKIGKWEITVGTPKATDMTNSPDLYSRIVVIKGAETPEQFRQSLAKQLPPGTVATIGERRKLKIKRFTVIGFEVFAHTPDPKTLQIQGLGGKRKIGCGFFEKVVDKSISLALQ